ncbi:MAG TPA: homoserine dehydrogenase [Lachnospiraceae bacterium]|nr:homoserine dehydrogenase [Lachnospiraceae bacterium]
MAQEEINVALLGFGTVGTGVYKIMQRQRPEMMQKLNTYLNIRSIMVRNPEKHQHKVEDPGILTTSFESILEDPQIDIVVELIGGIEPAYTYIRSAMEAGKSVVTANKDLIAERGGELFQVAEENHVELRFEAAVAGGIPIISPLKNSLAANEIRTVMGIVNGTTNYILSKMTDEGMDYKEALAQATELGYAEADPTADVEGYDAGRKIAILATIAFHSRVTFRDVYTEGITKITAKDISYAKTLGRVIKLIAVANHTPEGIEAKVHPMLLPESHPLSSVSGSYNAVYVNGDAVEDVMFYGRGAGEMPTASAVMGDVFAVARRIKEHSQGSTRDNVYRTIPVKRIENTRSSYFIRMSVEDKPGVLATIASIFGNNSVSIEQVIQKNKIGNDAELVIITSNVKERHIKDALLILESSSVVRKVANMIRVY